MKIIRADKIKGERKPFGRITKKLLEHKFREPISDIVFYLSSMPTGKLDKHYHAESEEIICFPKGGKINVNGRLYEMREWDMVLLDIGDVHSCEEECGDVIHFAIKMPNVEDKVNV